MIVHPITFFTHLRLISIWQPREEVKMPMGSLIPPSPDREYTSRVIAALWVPYIVVAFLATTLLGKISSWPTIEVYVTELTALPVFTFGIVEIVLYHRHKVKSVWRHSWLFVEILGFLYVAFTVAWLHRSTSSHLVLATGAALIIFGWFLLGYEIRATGEYLSAKPYVPFVGMAAVAALAGAAISWFLQHPAVAHADPPATAQQIQYVPVDPPTSLPPFLVKLDDLAMAIGYLVLALLAVKTFNWIKKFTK